MVKVAALITSFNRKQVTLRCLEALFASTRQGYELVVYLVDDASPDGTGDAVRALFPEVHVVGGDGDLYWNRGMLSAWRHALDSGADYYLWLNDDTELRPGAISDLIALHQKVGPKAIVCGRIADPVSGRPVYGGLRRNRTPIRVAGITVWTRISSELAGEDLFCDTMNGNCVLIPAAAVQDIGLISELYWHSEGDTDYGFRALDAGYKVAQLPEFVATGSYNEAFEDERSKLTLRNWRHVFFHPKGRRLVEAYHFFRQHYRPLWQVRLVWSYVRMIRLRS